MKDKSRFVAIMLMVMMVLSMTCVAACGAKEEPVQTQEATAPPEATPTATPEPTPTQDPTLHENGFTFARMNTTMTTTANLNVRSLPNIEGGKIGMVPEGAQVHVSGRCEEPGWYRVTYQGEIGYVSYEYLE